ncbi:DUF257 domain-containing protein [Thermococcus argininiproducens]|uniref:DUF257 domain-containing protein n=1 Tax=Thermococcus argininiproducens TaxID=2866384 RepID=A0A9E7MAD4_9EURY|nr:DUF257 family protein [Thermococcus argininiproducens]USG99973.1 DUF257 domain-containing protein [Thermococcus argininiproducens]
MEITKEAIFNLIDRTPFGDLVLIEDETSYGSLMTSYLLTRYARERGLKILVDDVLDSLFVVKKHLEFFGIRDDFSDVLTIKTGGKKNIGKVITRIPLETEPVVYLSRYESAARAVYSQGKYINLVLGLERLFAFMQSPFEFYTVMNSIQGFLGNKSRKAFYIIDKNVASTFKFNLIPELERIATTVLYIQGGYGKGKIRFVKTPFVEWLNEKFEITLDELLKW